MADQFVDECWDRIDDLQAEIAVTHNALLSYLGWRHTSSTPDCVRRWVKTLPDNTTIMTTEADALRMEGANRG